MKYKVGDKVKIKSLDWYNENKDDDGFVHCGDRIFDNYMSVFCGSFVTKLDNHETWTIGIDEVKPYLFPFSSMTGEQKIELNRLGEEECDIIEYVVNNPNPKNIGFPVVTHYMVDWCNKNHFDYRGLIEKSLALDATGENIY